MEHPLGASNRAAGQSTPEHVAVIRALAALDYQFDAGASVSADDRTRGYAADSVVEVTAGSSPTVSLLFSASPARATVVGSTMAIVAVASATGVDFLEWLTKQMRTRGRDRPWVASRTFKRRRVRAELLTVDAMLLTVESAR